MVFLRTFLVPLFPFGYVCFPLPTGMSLKFIVANLVPTLKFLFFFLASSLSVLNSLTVATISVIC